jgi:hypothetical protein
MGVISRKALSRRSTVGILMADIFGLVCLALVLNVDLERASALELQQARASSDAAEAEPFAATLSVSPEGKMTLAFTSGDPDRVGIVFADVVAALTAIPDARKILVCADPALSWGDVRALTERLKQALDMGVWHCPR